MDEQIRDRVRETLRQVRWPGYDTDIVTAGFVRGITVSEGRVSVDFQPTTQRQDKLSRIEREIRCLLLATPGIEAVEIRRTLPVLDPTLSEGGQMTPLQAEVAEAGGLAEPDPMLGATSGAAHPDPRWDGRRPGGRGPLADTRYTGPLPVHQWEIDPTNSDADGGEAQLMLDDWEYRMWWQVHPTGLVYVSIQAIQDDTVDHGSAARRHPVGRAVAVNLVYDERRRAIVAIYGTAQDFRPFVEAFRRGFGWSADTDQESEERGATT